MDTFTIHLSKTTTRVTPRVNPKVNYKLQVVTMRRFKDFNKCTLLCKIPIVLDVGGMGEDTHTHTYFLSSYVVNLKK